MLYESFPEAGFAKTRTWLKQLPSRRLLAWDDDTLVGHLGLEHRMIGLDTGPASIFGIIDLCVSTSHWGRKIASRMLTFVEELAREHRIEFLILFADDARLYTNNGFQRVENEVVWLKIDEHQSLGMGCEIVEELMIKPVSGREWPAGRVDLLGYLF